MATLGFIALFVAIGIGVLFVAFSGGPGQAREAYLTGGRRGFKVIIPLIYVGLGLGVPALVIASREGETEGSTEAQASKKLSEEAQRGKDLFRQTCSSCHSLKAVNAHGVTGPDLDNIGQVTRQRVLGAIRIGGTGQGRMPAGLLEGRDAEAVAQYLSEVAGKE